MQNKGSKRLYWEFAKAMYGVGIKETHRQLMEHNQAIKDFEKILPELEGFVYIDGDRPAALITILEHDSFSRYSKTALLLSDYVIARSRDMYDTDNEEIGHRLREKALGIIEAQNQVDVRLINVLDTPEI